MGCLDYRQEFGKTSQDNAMEQRVNVSRRLLLWGRIRANETPPGSQDA